MGSEVVRYSPCCLLHHHYRGAGEVHNSVGSVNGVLRVWSLQQSLWRIFHSTARCARWEPYSYTCTYSTVSICAHGARLKVNGIHELTSMQFCSRSATVKFLLHHSIEKPRNRWSLIQRSGRVYYCTPLNENIQVSPQTVRVRRLYVCSGQTYILQVCTKSAFRVVGLQYFNMNLILHFQLIHGAHQ
jgi:hypothetical protein